MTCAVNFGDSPVPLADLPLPGPVALISDGAAPNPLPPGAALWSLPGRWSRGPSEHGVPGRYGERLTMRG